jgi:hypothetical protein
MNHLSEQGSDFLYFLDPQAGAYRVKASPMANMFGDFHRHVSFV